MSKNRTNPKSGWAKKADLQKVGPNGRALCRRCQIEVPKGRRTFCGEVCIHEWKLRSNTEYLRNCVFKRDRGVCAECKLDTHQLEIGLYRLRETSYAAHASRRSELQARGFDHHRSTFWDAEHKLAVIEGGGECGLDNIETLCQPCHKKRTRELAARRAAARKAGKSGVGILAAGGSHAAACQEDAHAEVHPQPPSPDGAVPVTPQQETPHPPEVGQSPGELAQG